MRPKIPLVLVTGGGTGGHTFPAEALVTELIKRRIPVRFMTDSRGHRYEGALSQIPMNYILARSLVGRAWWDLPLSILYLGIGTLEALWMIMRFNPRVIVGVGGYASFPVMVAGKLLGKKLIIHEQNAILGTVNRVLSPWVDWVATSFGKTKGIPKNIPTSHVGLPLRAPIIRVAKSPYPSITKGSFRIFITGGSQGARVLGDILPRAFQALPRNLQAQLKIYQQVRPEDLERVKKSYQGSSLSVSLSPFFHDIPEQLKNAHLFIGRSGSSSVAEVEAIGRPAIFIPLIHKDQQQVLNAKILVDRGAALLYRPEDLTVREMVRVLTDLFENPKKLLVMAKKAQQNTHLEAAKRLTDLVISFLSNRPPKKTLSKNKGV